MSKVYSIKCPNCGAPLNLLGGGRVESITCSYCKSVIDLNDNYKVLYQFKNISIPKSPFKIGMKGKMEGVEWTIIGWILYRDSEDRDDKWSEFLLFSPLYGYAWLVYEDGEISFSRRIRDLNLIEWQEEPKKILFFRGGHYILDGEKYYSVIDFVQGELNYIAKQNDKIECWDYRGVNGQSISIEKSQKEIEVYYNKKLDAKSVYDSFGVKEGDRVIKELSIDEKFHEELEVKKPLSFYGIVAIFLALLSMIILSFNEHKVIDEVVNNNRNTMFSISGDFLTHIHIKAQDHKTLNSYKLSIINNGKTIFEIDKDRVYFSKEKLGNSWSKRANGADIYIKLDLGRYLLKVEKIGTTTNSIRVVISDRSIRLLYILPLFIVIFIFLMYVILMGRNVSFMKILGITFTLLFFWSNIYIYKYRSTFNYWSDSLFYVFWGERI